MKRSELYYEQIANVLRDVKEEIIETLKKLGGKVNLDYYAIEYSIERYGVIKCNNDGYPVLAEFGFIQLDGENDFIVSASDWDDTSLYELRKDDIKNSDILGLLTMLDEVKEIADKEGEVMDSYDY